MSFFSELQRRNVVRAAIGYLAELFWFEARSREHSKRELANAYEIPDLGPG